MKKMLFLLTVICTLTTLNAQTLYYVNSGASPKSSSSSCQVAYFNSDASRVWIEWASVQQIRTNLANNSSYYDRKGHQGVTNESTGSIYGMAIALSHSYFQFQSSTEKAHIYKKDFYRNGHGIVSNSYLRTDYIAFSKDWKTMIINPMGDNPEYYVRVNKSEFEVNAANIDDLF